MKTEKLPDETMIKNGKANLQRGFETVGGNLFLTDQRVVFEAHAINVQTGATIIPLTDVASTTLCWTKFLNLIPIAPNSVAVSTTQGQEHKFVLFGRNAWKDAIDSQCKRAISR